MRCAGEWEGDVPGRVTSNSRTGVVGVCGVEASSTRIMDVQLRGRRTFRKRFAVIAAALLVLGALAAPLADAWVHGGEPSAGHVHQDCGLCRVVSLPEMQADGTVCIERLPASFRHEAPQLSKVHGLPARAPSAPPPPSRAPPA
jgi:hypothetical protein